MKTAIVLLYLIAGLLTHERAVANMASRCVPRPHLVAENFLVALWPVTLVVSSLRGPNYCLKDVK